MTYSQLIIVASKALKCIFKVHIILNGGKITECISGCKRLDRIAFRIQEITRATGNW